jgi:hypothetical protein
VTAIPELIEKIRQGPCLLLGRPSVQNLYIFLQGYCFARKDDGHGDYAFMAGFREHVRNRFRISSSQSWADIIQFFSVTEEDELRLFWKLYDEFLAKKAKKRKKAS